MAHDWNYHSITSLQELLDLFVFLVLNQNQTVCHTQTLWQISLPRIVTALRAQGSVFITSSHGWHEWGAVKSRVTKVEDFLTLSWHFHAKCPHINHIWDKTEERDESLPWQICVQTFELNHIDPPLVQRVFVALSVYFVYSLLKKKNTFTLFIYLFFDGHFFPKSDPERCSAEAQIEFPSRA